MGDLFEPTFWTRCAPVVPGPAGPHRSARTIETYTDTAEQLAAFAREHDQVDLDRGLIEDYLADLADRWKPSTVAFRYGRCNSSPSGWPPRANSTPIRWRACARLTCPRSPCRSSRQTTCARCWVRARGAASRSARHGHHRLFVDTGMRLAEMTNLTLDDLDMDYEVAVVLGKGRRPRSCPFGARTGQALDRYWAPVDRGGSRHYIQRCERRPDRSGGAMRDAG